jgi:hypothetical protein
MLDDQQEAATFCGGAQPAPERLTGREVQQGGRPHGPTHRPENFAA